MAKRHPISWNLEALAEELERVERARDVSPGAERDPHDGPQGAGPGRFWQPAADVLETAEAFVILVELPGLRREDIGLEVRGQRLILYGERRMELEAPATHHRVERGHGPFARAFTLGRDIRAEAIEAACKDGLLTVTIPKLGGQAGPKRIHVRAG